ncbi:MAG TPA: beta-ketoacyl-ACP synthase III [Candidatus Xenobia bacterium]|jgi:3-oxoacyl-[acyl-carrier-protein] synthase-3
MVNARIVGTGSYVPEGIITNADLEKLVDTTDEWITSRTGIKERRRTPATEATSDLGYRAAQRALEAAGLKSSELDVIIFCTITPDTHCPSAAAWLQGKLGAMQAVSFDVNAACSGFLFGLNVAEQFLKAGTARYVLVVAGETMTRATDYDDRSSCILWGDGAGAVVMTSTIGNNGHSRILSTHLHTDGTHADMLQYPGGGSAVSPISHETVDKKRHFIRMEGPESFKLAVRLFSEVCTEALTANGKTVEDVRWLVPHQANGRILQMVARQINFPLDKVYMTIQKYGNISSATVPIALDEAVRDGSIKTGDLVLLAAFGGGLTWGSSLIRW